MSKREIKDKDKISSKTKMVDAEEIEKDLEAKVQKLVRKVGEKRGRVQYYTTKDNVEMEDAFGIIHTLFESYSTVDYDIVINSNKSFKEYTNNLKQANIARDRTLAHEIAHYVLRSEGLYDAFELSEKEEHTLICAIERIVTEYEEVKKLYKGVK